MAASLTLIKQDLTEANQLGSPYARIRALVNFGSSYAAITRAALLALINTAIAAVRADVSASEVLAVMPSPSQDGQVLVNWDEANGQLEGSVLSSGTRPTAEVSDALTPASHVVTVPTGKLVVGGAITAGTATGALNLTSEAPATTLDGQYDPTAETVTLLAADAATAVKLLLIDPGTAQALAAASGDLSAAAKSFVCDILVAK